MKIIVPIKRVVESSIRIRVKSDGSGVDMTQTKMAMNPFDAIALEEALRLRESDIADEIVIVSIGNRQARDVLRSGLAMGADRGLHVMSDQPVEPLAIAKILAAIVGEEAAGLVLMGKLSTDDDNSQTGQMLAALLGWGQGTFASRLEITGNVARVVREVDTGLDTIELKLPAVVTTDLRLNEPRYASLPNIMKAKKKPLEERSLDAFGVDVRPRLKIVQVSEPPSRAAGQIVASVDELLEKLRDEIGAA